MDLSVDLHLDPIPTFQDPGEELHVRSIDIPICCTDLKLLSSFHGRLHFIEFMQISDAGECHRRLEGVPSSQGFVDRDNNNRGFYQCCTICKFSFVLRRLTYICIN